MLSALGFPFTEALCKLRAQPCARAEPGAREASITTGNGGFHRPESQVPTGGDVFRVFSLRPVDFMPKERLPL